MPYVYRIENEDGYGPYRGYPNICQILNMNDDDFHIDKDHPTLGEDFYYSIKEASSYLSAFENINQLYEWFGEYITPILDNGYSVVKIDVKSIKRGKSRKQCLFHPKYIRSKQEIKFNKHEKGNK